MEKLWKLLKKIEKKILQIKEKNKVYLLIENLKTKKKSKKLIYTKAKLFFIQIKNKRICFKLKSLKDAKIHPILYILLLKLVNSKTLIQNIFYYQI